LGKTAKGGLINMVPGKPGKAWKKKNNWASFSKEGKGKSRTGHREGRKKIEGLDC